MLLAVISMLMKQYGLSRKKEEEIHWSVHEATLESAKATSVAYDKVMEWMESGFMRWWLIKKKKAWLIALLQGCKTKKFMFMLPRVRITVNPSQVVFYYTEMLHIIKQSYKFVSWRKCCDQMLSGIYSYISPWSNGSVFTNSVFTATL